MRWSAALHYVGAIDDHPSQVCAFAGEHKWAGKPEINVLDAIKNSTSLLQAWVDNDASDAVATEAVKFLIHFVGDMHQPLHLTGRDRGGNSISVLFDRRHTNLHSVWDTYLLSKAIRMVPLNYSLPLPCDKVEAALQGAIYDSYIRRILFEGVFDAWANVIPDWLICAMPLSTLRPTAEKAIPSGNLSLLGLWKSLVGVVNGVQTIMSKLNPKTGVDILPDGPIVCPYYWAQPIHRLNCDIVWPVELDDPRMSAQFYSAVDECGAQEDVSDWHLEPCLGDEARANLIQLDSPKYSEVIAQRMVVERLLAQGGIRLAGILNYIFAPKDDKNQQGLFIININD